MFHTPAHKPTPAARPSGSPQRQVWPTADCPINRDSGRPAINTGGVKTLSDYIATKTGDADIAMIEGPVVVDATRPKIQMGVRLTPAKIEAALAAWFPPLGADPMTLEARMRKAITAALAAPD